MTLKADAELLVQRLRNAHHARVEWVGARKHAAAHAAATIAQDLVDDASPELLRAALTVAAQPDGGQPPIPVVLGPQDAAAATVSIDELMNLVGIYGEACSTWAPGRRATDEQIMAAFAEVRKAAETLALAALAGQVGAAHSDGRLS